MLRKYITIREAAFLANCSTRMLSFYHNLLAGRDGKDHGGVRPGRPKRQDGTFPTALLPRLMIMQQLICCGIAAKVAAYMSAEAKVLADGSRWDVQHCGISLSGPVVEIPSNEIDTYQVYEAA